jgi:hypothetical protein
MSAPIKTTPVLIIGDFAAARFGVARFEDSEVHITNLNTGESMVTTETKLSAHLQTFWDKEF